MLCCASNPDTRTPDPDCGTLSMMSTSADVLCFLYVRPAGGAGSDVQETLELGALSGEEEAQQVLHLACVPRGAIGYKEARAGWRVEGKRSPVVKFNGEALQTCRQERKALIRFCRFARRGLRCRSRLWLVSSCGSRQQAHLLATRLLACDVDLLRAAPCESVGFLDVSLAAARINSPLEESPSTLSLPRLCSSFGVRYPRSGPLSASDRVRVARALGEALVRGQESGEGLAEVATRVGAAWTLEEVEKYAEAVVEIAEERISRMRIRPKRWPESRN